MKTLITKPVKGLLVISALAVTLPLLTGITRVRGADNPAMSSSQTNASVGMTQRIDDWEQLVKRLQNAPMSERLAEVNRFFNNLRFLSDQTVWGAEDYWASPREFLRRGTGDCEDYAIAKYITLRRLGIDDSQLRLAYVRSLTLRQAHMVLIVEQDNGKQVVLDNLTGNLQSPDNRNDLEPVYSFNSTGLWLLDSDYKERRIGQATRLNHWVQVQQKSENPDLW